MLGQSSLFIQNDPRLSEPCTVWERSISLKELIRRFGVANHVRLDYACPFPDLRLVVYVDCKPAGKVLQLVAGCLDLDWRRTGSGYELFMPEGVATVERDYDGEVAKATTVECRKRFAAWRGMQAIPVKKAEEIVAAFAATPNPYAVGTNGSSGETARYDASSQEASNARSFFDGPESAFVPFAHAAGPDILERLVRGETVIACTARIPGLVTLPGRSDDYRVTPSDRAADPTSVFFMAVKLDLDVGEILYSTWRTGKQPARSDVQSVRLVGGDAFYSPLVLTDSALGRRVRAWSGPAMESWAFRDELEKRAGGSFPPAVAMTAPISGNGAAAAVIAQATGLSVVLMRPPEREASNPPEAPRSLSEVWSQLTSDLVPGIWRLDDESLQWRPGNYRFRAELAALQTGIGTEGSGAVSPTVALKEVCSRMSVRERWPSSGYDRSGSEWRFNGVPPPVTAFISSLGPEQVRRAVSLEDSKAYLQNPQSFPTAVKAGLPISSLSAAQRVLAREALRSFCLKNTFAPATRSDWDKLLTTANSSGPRFFVRAARMDIFWFFDSHGSGYGEGAIPSPDEWKTALRRENLLRFVFRREWVFDIGFGLSDGTSIGTRVQREADVFEASAEDLRLSPDAVYRRLVEVLKR